MVYVIQVCRRLQGRSIWYMSYRFVDGFRGRSIWYMSYRFVDSFRAGAYGVYHTGLWKAFEQEHMLLKHCL